MCSIFMLQAVHFRSPGNVCRTFTPNGWSASLPLTMVPVLDLNWVHKALHSDLCLWLDPASTPTLPCLRVRGWV